MLILRHIFVVGFTLNAKQNCGFPKNLGLPYWDWTRDYKTGLDKAPLWGTEPWQLGPATGTGENWIIEEFHDTVAYPRPHRITRRYNHYPFRKAVQSSVLTSSFAANSKVALTDAKVANNTVLPTHIIQKAKAQTGDQGKKKPADDKKTKKPAGKQPGKKQGDKPAKKDDKKKDQTKSSIQAQAKPAVQPSKAKPAATPTPPKRSTLRDLVKRLDDADLNPFKKQDLAQDIDDDDPKADVTGEDMVTPEVIKWVEQADDYETFAVRLENTVSDSIRLR